MSAGCYLLSFFFPKKHQIPQGGVGHSLIHHDQRLLVTVLSFESRNLLTLLAASSEAENKGEHILNITECKNELESKTININTTDSTCNGLCTTSFEIILFSPSGRQRTTFAGRPYWVRL